MKDKICQTALSLFLRDGLKKTTMDHLALALRISKKTVYQYFASKEELIEKCMAEMNTMVLMHLKFIQQSNFLASKELLEMKYYIDLLIKFSFSSFQNEHSRFYAKVETKQQKFLLHKILPYIEKNLEKGQKEGVFKSNIDVEFSSWSFLVLASSNFSFPHEEDEDTVRLYTMDFYLSATATEKGRNEFNLLSTRDARADNWDSLLRVI